MFELIENVYIGSEADYYQIQNTPNWAVLHCCKHPFHCLFVGYKGNLSPMHPDYALKRLGNEMALNLVDMDRFSPTYLDFNRKMFEVAFAFLDEYREKGYKMLIHCNQGESRAPTLGMLYVARLGAYNYVGFEESVQRLRMVYPQYAPKNNIYQTVAALWQDFVKR